MRFGISAASIHLMRAGPRSAWTICGMRPISIVNGIDPPGVLPHCSTCWATDDPVDTSRLTPDGRWLILQGPRMAEVYDACRWLDDQYNADVEKHNDRRRSGEHP